MCHSLQCRNVPCCTYAFNAALDESNTIQLYVVSSENTAIASIHFHAGGLVIGHVSGQAYFIRHRPYAKVALELPCTTTDTRVIHSPVARSWAPPALSIVSYMSGVVAVFASYLLSIFFFVLVHCTDSLCIGCHSTQRWDFASE